MAVIDANAATAAAQMFWRRTLSAELNLLMAYRPAGALFLPSETSDFDAQSHIECRPVISQRT
jgi:hypothetical protein